MKLLLDQNLSHKLIAALLPDFPGSKHVSSLGLSEQDDDTIWKVAAVEGFAIVSKDSDFSNRSFLRGHPPKVIQLRLGNCSTRALLEVLLRDRDIINQFLANQQESLLIIE